MSGVLLGAGLAGAASAAGCAALAHGIFSPRSSLLCPVIASGDRGAPSRISMTFDDGPWPGSTEAILAQLGARGVHAAFFVIGSYARRWPDLVRRIHDDGHLVANHSESHHHWGAARHTDYWRRELDMASDAIEVAIGQRPLLFRPPLGYKNWLMAAAARERGMTAVAWTCRGMDGVPTTPDRIVRRVLRGAAPGGIVVLHDGVDPFRRRDPSPTLAALGPILDGLSDLGLRCERLDRLIGRSAYSPGEPARGGGRHG